MVSVALLSHQVSEGEEPRLREVKKQAFIPPVLLHSEPGDTALAKVIMKQIKSQTQASLFPTPKIVNIVQNSIYSENSHKTASPKTPRNSENIHDQ